MKVSNLWQLRIQLIRMIASKVKHKKRKRNWIVMMTVKEMMQSSSLLNKKLKLKNGLSLE